MAFENSSASLIAAITPTAEYRFLAVHNGVAYTIGGTSSAGYLASINLSTGVATRIGTATTFGVTGGAVRIVGGLASNGTNLYLSLHSVPTVAAGLYTLDVSDGTATLVGLNATTGRIAWTGNQMYIQNSANLYTLDISDGSTTLVGALDQGGNLFWDSQESQMYQTFRNEIDQIDISTAEITLDAILDDPDTDNLFASQTNSQFHLIQQTPGNANLYSLAREIPTTATIDTSSITTAGSTYQIPITFNKNITLTADDIVVEGASEGMLMGSGTMYMLPITIPNSLTDVNVVITLLDTGGLDTVFTARATARANITQNTTTNLNSYILSLPHNFDRQVTDGSMNTVTQVTDNNKLTYWESTATLPTLNFQIGGATVDSIYIVGQNIADFEILVGSDTLIDGTTNETDGSLQYAFYTGLTAQSGTTATLEIVKQTSAQPVRIYQVMLMEQLWHFPDASFSVIDLSREKRGSITQEALDYSTSRTIPILNYQKHMLALEVSRFTIEQAQAFGRLTDELTNFAFCREWPRWPDQVYTCHFRDDIQSTYPSRRTSAGVRENYVIQQS